MEGTAVTHVEVREASGRLPERQREALALRDRDGRSYEEIAASFAIGLGAVAQLIAHARINLYDELRGTALASVAPSPECERALPLIAMREDGQLEPVSEDANWLDSHLAGCERCALAVEQMGEADAAYRAQQSERPGGDAARTDGPAARIRRPGARRPPEPAGIPVATPTRRSRRTLLVACLAGLLLLGVAAAVLAATDRSTAPVESAAKPNAGGEEPTTRPAGKSENGARAPGDHEKQVAKRSEVGGDGAADPAAAAAESPGSLPAAAPAETGSGGAAPGKAGSGGNRSSGKAAVEPTRQTSSSKPSERPKSPPASTSAPPSTTTAAAPPPESPPPAEAEVDEPGHRGEPPGKAVGHPSH